MATVSPELLAILGIVGVHLLPRLIGRLGIPTLVSTVILGVFAGFVFSGLAKEGTFHLLATIGLASLYLTTGLKVDPTPLSEKPALLYASLALFAFSLVALALPAGIYLGLEPRDATLAALAILTPSAGVLFEGLDRRHLSQSEASTGEQAATAIELLALVIFFFMVQSRSFSSFALGILAVAVALFVVPFLLRSLSRVLLKVTPGADFPLLILTALVCAAITRGLGVHLLIGAYAVGIVLRRLQQELPELASTKNLEAVELFAAFFVPFYFAAAGMRLEGPSFDWRAFALASSVIVLVTPLRFGLNHLLFRLVGRESAEGSTRIAALIAPTLVFSTIVVEALDRELTPPYIRGGLILAALASAFIPTFVLPKWPAPAPSEPSSPTS